ncbi:hypothetical protein CTA2_6340, partial [Colletotrichum tanaceti]
MTVVKNTEAGVGSSAPPPPPRHSDLNLDQVDSQEVPDALVSDGFSLPSLEPETMAPPAYGDLPNQLQFNQAGFEAGANVTGDGRVNININQSGSRLAEILAPTLR